MTGPVLQDKITEEWEKIKDVFLCTITVQGQALPFLKSEQWKIKRVKKLVIEKRKLIWPLADFLISHHLCPSSCIDVT